MSKPKSLSRETTLQVRDACLCLHAQRAARALARRFDTAFRPLGITNGQFSLMMSLNRPDPPSIQTVADFLAMDRTTLTAKLKPLVRNGFVRIGVDPADRRSRRLSLTDAGRALLVDAFAIWERAHAGLEAETAAAHAGFDADRLRGDLLALS